MLFVKAIDDGDDSFVFDLLSERIVPSYDITDTDEGPQPIGDVGDFEYDGDLMKNIHESALVKALTIQRYRLPASI